MLLLTLPYPPSTNHLYIRTRTGRVSLSARAVNYRATARAIAMEAGHNQPIAGTVAIFLDVFRPQRRGDLDNILKALLDSLNGIAWNDDSQIVQITANRYDDPRSPRITIAIIPLETRHDTPSANSRRHSRRPQRPQNNERMDSTLPRSR